MWSAFLIVVVESTGNDEKYIFAALQKIASIKTC